MSKSKLIQANKLFLIIASVFLWPIEHALADWFYEGTAELLFNDNLNRAVLDSDIRSDINLEGELVAGYFAQVAEYTGVTANAAFSLAHFQKISDLNHASLNLGLSFSHKFGVGEKVPRLNGTVSIGEHKYEYEIRDVQVRRADLSLVKRFNDYVEISLGINHEDRDSGHYSSFATNSFSTYVDGFLDLNATDWIGFSYVRMSGEITSSSSPSPTMLNASTATNKDKTFERGGTIIAYRLDAQTDVYSVDWNRALSNSATFYIGIEKQDSKASAGINYDVNMFRTGLMFSW